MPRTYGNTAASANRMRVTNTGLIIPTATNLQQALMQMEAYVQNLEETFEQHHHDDRYRLPSVRVHNNAGAIGSITTGGALWGPIPFDQELIDTHGAHSTVSNNSRLNLGAIRLGIWKVGWGIWFTSGTYVAGTDLGVYCVKNGTWSGAWPANLTGGTAVTVHNLPVTNDAGMQPSIIGSDLVSITSPGDYVEMAAYSDATTTNVIGATDAYTHFWALYTGPA